MSTDPRPVPVAPADPPFALRAAAPAWIAAGPPPEPARPRPTPGLVRSTVEWMPRVSPDRLV